MIIPPGSTSPSVEIAARTLAGAALQSKVAADFILWYRRPGAALQSIALFDLSAVDDDWSAGGIIHVDDDWYRLDLPVAACAAGVNHVLVGGAVSGGTVISGPIDLEGLGTSVWSHASRTLTQTGGEVAAAGNTGDLTRYRTTVWTVSLTGLGNISTRTKLYFTVKVSKGAEDSRALVQIEETAGLVYINGASAATAANGSLVVTDEATGAMTVTLKAPETLKLPEGDYFYDLKMVTAAGPSLLTNPESRFYVRDPATEAIS